MIQSLPPTVTALNVLTHIEIAADAIQMAYTNLRMAAAKMRQLHGLPERNGNVSTGGSGESASVPTGSIAAPSRGLK